MSVILLTPDGTRVRHNGTELRQCPLDATKGAILFCSREGTFYSRHVIANGATEMRELKSTYSPSQQKGYVRESCGSRYPRMRQACNACHILMALTWIGPRPQGYEIDHLNGDILNWSADNLQYVTPEENRRRAVILRELRANGTDPAQLSREQLISLFNA